jgi:diacylglycerol kinase (ATP)
MQGVCYNLINMALDGVTAHLIHNPTAGPWDVQQAIQRICAQLEERGWSIQLKQTKRSGDATVLAREAAQAGCDVVVVAGGDGTLNEAVNGLVDTRTALGVLPVGTGNRWARQLGLPLYLLANPLRVHEAAAGLAEAAIRQIDVGKVNERYFLCWAGIGLDAQITTEMEPRPRHTKHLGIIPYIIAGVLVARDFQGVRTRVQLDDKVVRGRTLLILASNIQQYAGQLHVAPQARLDDGLLDVFVFKGLGFSYALRHLFTMLNRRWLQDPRIVHRQARFIKIQTDRPIPVQVDGDPVGATTPVTLQVTPCALRVLVPPSASPGLFASPQL